MSAVIDPDQNQPPPHIVPPEGIAHPRSIRSFVRRTGRPTAGQARALADHGAAFILPFRQQLLDFPALFGREAPVVLEIGFGMGEATAQIATTLADTNFLCCEVHDPGVGALVKRIVDEQLQNIRIVQHDAVEGLQPMVPAPAPRSSWMVSMMSVT